MHAWAWHEGPRDPHAHDQREYTLPLVIAEAGEQHCPNAMEALEYYVNTKLDETNVAHSGPKLIALAK